MRNLVLAFVTLIALTGAARADDLTARLAAMEAKQHGGEGVRAAAGIAQAAYLEALIAHMTPAERAAMEDKRAINRIKHAVDREARAAESDRMDLDLLEARAPAPDTDAFGPRRAEERAEDARAQTEQLRAAEREATFRRIEQIVNPCPMGGERVNASTCVVGQ